MSLVQNADVPNELLSNRTATQLTRPTQITRCAHAIKYTVTIIAKAGKHTQHDPF